jgi:hypothetical protein
MRRVLAALFLVAALGAVVHRPTFIYGGSPSTNTAGSSHDNGIGADTYHDM